MSWIYLAIVGVTNAGDKERELGFGSSSYRRHLERRLAIVKLEVSISALR